MKPVARGDRPRRASRPLGRRHRSDHPVGLAQASRTDRIRCGAVLRMARRPLLRAQPAGVRRCHHLRGGPELRHRLVSRTRRVGVDGLRLRGRRSRRASATSSATTAPSRVSFRRRWTRNSGAPCSTPCSRDPSLELTIDVARGTIEAPAAGLSGTFPLDEFTRERLLNGWDDIGLTLRHAGSIADYETHRPDWLPVTTG